MHTFRITLYVQTGKNKNRILSKKEIESRLFLNLRKNEISKKNSFIKKIAKKNNIVIFVKVKKYISIVL